jgi:hypothetical protein
MGNANTSSTTTWADAPEGDYAIDRAGDGKTYLMLWADRSFYQLGPNGWQRVDNAPADIFTARSAPQTSIAPWL